jgi:hypothetical protein
MNGTYLKYFVEIILTLKFLIYRTYSDRYRIKKQTQLITDSIQGDLRGIMSPTE